MGGRHHPGIAGGFLRNRQRKIHGTKHRPWLTALLARKPTKVAAIALANKSSDLRVPAPRKSKKVAMMGMLDWTRRKLIVTTSRTKRSTDFIAHLQVLDHLYGPWPRAPSKPVVIVLDNGPIHVSKASLAALAERAHWLTVEWLPKYAPELNDIEIVWGDLKAHQLAHQTFIDADALDQAIHRAVAALELRTKPRSVGRPTNLCLGHCQIQNRPLGVKAGSIAASTRIPAIHQAEQWVLAHRTRVAWVICGIPQTIWCRRTHW